MSWNKPSSDSQSVARKAPKGSPSLVRGVVAGLVVAVLGIAAFFVFNGKSAKPKVEKSVKKPAQIEEVKPAATGTNVVAKQIPYWEVDASQTNGFTEGMVKKWKLAHRPLPKVLPMADRPKAKYAIFNHPSENQIASFLTRKPGQGVIGTPVFGERFEKDFLKSCEEPILIGADDDDFTKDLKQQMIETKIDLRQRMSEGENLSKIMLDTHKELQRLGQVKKSIELDMRQMIAENAQSEADVDLIFNAANKMLEEKGIAPMKSNLILKKSFMRLINKEAQ